MKDIKDIKDLIFELENTLFDQEGRLKEDAGDLMIWLRFHRFGVGLMSALEEEKVIKLLEATEVGEYFDQGICLEQRESLKQNPYLVAREELCEVVYVNQGATEEEAHALSEPVEAYAVVATEEELIKAHEGGCYTILLMDESEDERASNSWKEQTAKTEAPHISKDTQQLADVVCSDLEAVRDWLDEQYQKSL